MLYNNYIGEHMAGLVENITSIGSTTNEHCVDIETALQQGEDLQGINYWNKNVSKVRVILLHQ